MASATVANVPAMRPGVVRVDQIVVVESDPAMRKVLQRLFAAEGYDVKLISDGTSVLEVLRTRPPSAVILDLPSPRSVGCDLCREITRMLPGLPLVVLSATCDVVDKVLLLEMGADDFVTIP